MNNIFISIIVIIFIKITFNLANTMIFNLYFYSKLKIKYHNNHHIYYTDDYDLHHI